MISAAPGAMMTEYSLNSGALAVRSVVVGTSLKASHIH